MFQFKLIKTQITSATGLSLVAAIFAMAAYGIWSGQSLHNKTSDAIITYSETMVEESLKQVSGQIAQVSRTVSSSILLAQSIATTQSYLAENNKVGAIGRGDFSDYLRHVLVENSQVVGTYIVWDQGEVDNADSQFRGEGNHSDANGQFSPYWTRSASGELNVRPSNMGTVYDDVSKNSRGLRRGEWYWCPVDNGQPCVSDPSVWEVQGVPTLMTSITTPLIVEGRTIGVAGVDVSMQFIQQLTEQVNSQIYNGAGELKIYSHNGSIVADTKNPSSAGSVVSDATWNKIKGDVQSGNPRTSFSTNYINILLPLTFASTNMRWAVELTVPTSVAMSQANTLNSDISDSFNSSIVGQVVAGVLFGLAGFAGVYYVAGMVSYPVRHAARLVEELSQSDGDLTRRVRIKHKNEIGRLAQGLNSFLEKTHDVVTETSESVLRLTDVAKRSCRLSMQTEESVNSQKSELSQVSSAVYQMSQASAEVARNCADTANSAKDAHSKVQICAQELNETVQSLQGLTQHMREAAGNMDELEVATQSISGILDVIKGISEQTNLLALNAAIEAARAGEQGRGFAVVADEVRSLASRTQESTEQINNLMQSLVTSAALSVKTMREGTKTCEDNVHRAIASQEQLNEIVTSTQSISGASITIASAVEQQNAVADEISRNVTNINDAVNLIADYATQAKQESAAVDETVIDIQNKLNQFKY